MGSTKSKDKPKPIEPETYWGNKYILRRVEVYLLETSNHYCALQFCFASGSLNKTDVFSMPTLNHHASGHWSNRAGVITTLVFIRPNLLHPVHLITASRRSTCGKNIQTVIDAFEKSRLVGYCYLEKQRLPHNVGQLAETVLECEINKTWSSLFRDSDEFWGEDGLCDQKNMHLLIQALIDSLEIRSLDGVSPLTLDELGLKEVHKLKDDERITTYNHWHDYRKQ